MKRSHAPRVRRESGADKRFRQPDRENGIALEMGGNRFLTGCQGDPLDPVAFGQCVDEARKHASDARHAAGYEFARVDQDTGPPVQFTSRLSSVA